MKSQPIPFFGARKFARALQEQLAKQEQENQAIKARLAELNALSIWELDERRKGLEEKVRTLSAYHEKKLQEITRQHESLCPRP